MSTMNRDKILEIAAGTEGVPNGEWADDKSQTPNIVASERYNLATTRLLYTPLAQVEAVTRHFLNCHPDTIKELCRLALIGIEAERLGPSLRALSSQEASK